MDNEVRFTFVVGVLGLKIDAPGSDIVLKNLDEKLLPKANQLIKELGWLYPFATYIHRVTWDTNGEGQAKIADPKTLFQLSKDERRIPIDKRSY